MTTNRSNDSRGCTAMAGSTIHVRRHAARRAASTARQPKWLRLAVMLGRAPALATFSAAIGLAVGVLGFAPNSVTRTPVVATHSPAMADRPVALTPIGSLASRRVGQRLLPVRSPLGFVGTVTSGVISPLNRAEPIAVDRDHRTVLNAIQTDVAPTPGSSDGALVNMDGKPIGANSAMAGLGEAGHIWDGAARQRGAAPATELVVCVRRVCNPKE